VGGLDGSGCKFNDRGSESQLTRTRFLIEGLMSITVGLASFFVMPANITETHKILRGKATWLQGKMAGLPRVKKISFCSLEVDILAERWVLEEGRCLSETLPVPGRV
jgi:hypothetical protein